MVSDRGTLPRGAVADQQASWAEPTAPGGRRMPSAPRERKPALAALAVLLGLDWLEGRRTQGNADLQADARLDELMQQRLQQATPTATRRRPAAANQVAAKAA